MDALIPNQVKGKENNIQHEKILSSRKEAATLFDLAYRRITNPLNWHKLSGITVARFLEPADPNINQQPVLREGNYLRIEIPGPGPKTGDGFDWVKIDKIISEKNPEATTEIFGMTFRASSNPENNAVATAHFFQSLATSTFIIQRNENKVISSYHGRNEVPNLHTGSTLGNIRNAFVAVGAAAGLSETVWSILVKSFLKDAD